MPPGRFFQAWHPIFENPLPPAVHIKTAATLPLVFAGLPESFQRPPLQHFPQKRPPPPQLLTLRPELSPKGDKPQNPVDAAQLLPHSGRREGIRTALHCPSDTHNQGTELALKVVRQARLELSGGSTPDLLRPPPPPAPRLQNAAISQPPSSSPRPSALCPRHRGRRKVGECWLVKKFPVLQSATSACNFIKGTQGKGGEAVETSEKWDWKNWGSVPSCPILLRFPSYFLSISHMSSAFASTYFWHLLTIPHFPPFPKFPPPFPPFFPAPAACRLIRLRVPRMLVWGRTVRRARAVRKVGCSPPPGVR